MSRGGLVLPGPHYNIVAHPQKYIGLMYCICKRQKMDYATGKARAVETRLSRSCFLVASNYDGLDRPLLEYCDLAGKVK